MLAELLTLLILAVVGACVLACAMDDDDPDARDRDELARRDALTRALTNEPRRWR